MLTAAGLPFPGSATIVASRPPHRHLVVFFLFAATFLATAVFAFFSVLAVFTATGDTTAGEAGGADSHTGAQQDAPP